MNELEKAREEIARIDEEMCALFERRMRQSRAVAAYKAAHGLPVKDEAREKALIERCRSLVGERETEEYYVSFLRKVIDLSCDYQNRLLSGLRVAYSGVEGAFAHIAGRRLFPQATFVPCADFGAVGRAVESGECDCGVLPLENSLAGEVGAVTDLLFSGELYINDILDLPVTHCLLAPRGADPAGIRTAVSHPQALEQCREYIRRRGLATEVYANTALAAKHVRDLGDPAVAAIASRETAELFGLDVLEEGINDSDANTTRFASVSRAPNRPEGGERRGGENFILLFTVKNEAGALAQTLDIIGAHGYNMRTLRSRPMKGLAWNYYFYVEAEGNIRNENGQNLLRELSAVCSRLRLVGTYDANKTE